MINISIPAIWIAFFGALFGAMLGVALSFWIIKREVQREVRRIENEYKFLLVQGLVGGVLKYFFKDEETTVCKEDAKHSGRTVIIIKQTSAYYVRGLFYYDHGLTDL